MKERKTCQRCGALFEVKWAHNPNLYCSRSCVRARPAQDRFWQKVKKTDLCWLWTGAKIKGYGVLWLGDRNVPAHRFAYELLVEPIPDGLTIDHLCRNVACVNPDHLEPVTGAENNRRGFGVAGVNIRKTHCLKGHPLSGNNLYISPKGGRRCRECMCESTRQWRRKYPEKHRADVRRNKQRKRERERRQES